MLRALRDRLTYSNVVASVALFMALGGVTYAVTKDSVKSKHIVNGEVKSADLENDGVKGKDVKENELTNEDIDETTLYPGGGGPDGANTFTVPVGGAFSAQIRSIGGDGATLYGSPTGVGPASADFLAAATGTPFDTGEIGQMRVKLAAPLGTGESRTFTLSRDFDGLTPIDTSITCTIEEGEQECSDSERTQVTNPFIAVKITSTGAGLVSTDDAWVGFAVKQKANL
jgi:hypothetical protein